MSILRRRGIHNHGVIGLGDMGTGALGGYREKVLGLNPIAYWMQGETAGTTALCEISAAQNGTYGRDVSVMGTGAGIGDGRTAPDFNGAADYNNVYTAALNGAFNGQEFTAATWVRVSGAGVWTDGASRYIMHMRVNGNNLWYFEKAAANDRVTFAYLANAVVKSVNHAITDTEWFHVAMSVSLSAGVNGEMKAYVNGAQTGATQTALGTWAGALFANWSAIGAQNNVPNNPFDGFLAHGVLFGSALTGPQIAQLATV